MNARVRLLLWSFLLVTVLLIVVPALGAARQADTDEAMAKIEPELWQAAQQGEAVGFFAVLGEQADTSSAEAMLTKLEKGRLVFDALRATADRTQAGLRAYLDEKGVNYQPYYIANVVFIEAGQDVLLAVAARPEVSEVFLNHTFRAIDPIISAAPEGPKAVPNTTEWNVSWINADDVWSQYGVTGFGAVVGDLDTGVDWDHPSLKNNYRGWDGAAVDHNYNWWDATTNGANDIPYDDFGHGTHTTGTAVGYDPGLDLHIGVAPDAEWVGCKNMNSGGSGTDEWFMTCFQFALAPWDLNGQNPNPDLAPDVLNNSWGYFGGGVDTFYTIIQNLRDAGVLTEVSAGNEGPGCSSLRSPGDYDNVFTTGATANRSETLVSFSSRGPSSLYPGVIKPDIVAPGENINSALPGTGYSGETWSGTSMSGPHVVGTVALLVSADPGIKGQVEFIESLMRDTAYQGMPDPPNPDTCGGTPYNVVPNHIYGWGRLDALAAVTLVASSGHLEGIVSDQASGSPIPGASVEAHTGQLATTDPTGYYTMTLAAGTYTVTATAYGWQPQTVAGIEIVEDQTTTQDLILGRAPGFAIRGLTLDASTEAPIGAHLELQLNGVPVAMADSNPANGRFQMRAFAGTYELVATAPGYAPIEQTMVLNSNKQVRLLFQPNWQLGGDTPFALTRFDAAYFDSGAGQTYDQKVYFLGGRQADDSTTGVIVQHDPLTGVYAPTGATMPTPLSNYTINVLQDSTGLGLYVVGGRDANAGMLNTVQVYYPATNTTATITTDPMLGPGRIPGGTAVVNNKLYIFGGFDAVRVYAPTMVYDPMAAAGSRWSVLSDLGLARGYILTAVVDGKIYAMGGDTWDGFSLFATATTEVFDTANPGAGWNDAAVAELPIACDEAQAVGFDSDSGSAYAGMILTAGCGQWPAETADSFSYDVNTNTWDTAFPDINEARRNHAGAYIPIGSTPGFWIFGGRQGTDQTLLTMTEYFPIAP